MIHFRKKTRRGKPPPAPALRCGLPSPAGTPPQRPLAGSSAKSTVLPEEFLRARTKTPGGRTGFIPRIGGAQLAEPHAYFAPADKSSPIRYRRIPVLMRIIFVLRRFYGRSPMPPSSVIVSPFIYLKSPPAIWTQTRPMSFSTSPSRPAGGMRTFCRYASG